MLLSHITGHPKSWLLAHNEETLSPSEILTLQHNLQQILQGFPLPYLIGTWAFYGRQFEVSPAVLIPRPETELLVANALTLLKDGPQALIVDVGTGSGIIAVTLACEQPQARIVAADISRPALKIAARNAERLSPGRIKFLQADLLTPIRAKFDLICANLPYIPKHTLDELPDLRWEPRSALEGGESGLALIEGLLLQAPSNLKPGGRILLEIESTLGRQALSLAQSLMPGSNAWLVKDLAEKVRLLVIGP